MSPYLERFHGFPRNPAHQLQHGDVCIVRLSRQDTLLETGTWQFLRLWLESHEAAYPGIAKWADEKVRPGVIHGLRDAMLLMKYSFKPYDLTTPYGPLSQMAVSDMRIIGAGISKLGPDALKFCHLSVLPEERRKGYGTHLLQNLTGANPLGNGSQSLVLTLPESVWADHGNFLKPLGLTEPTAHHRQYRGKGDMELYMRTSLGRFRRGLKTALYSASAIEKIERPQLIKK